jgi:hypothetical protein
MGGISGQSEFVDYRAIYSGVATVPSGSVVASAKNETCDLEHVFGHDQRASAQRARLRRRWALSDRNHAVAARGKPRCWSA